MKLIECPTCNAKFIHQYYNAPLMEGFSPAQANILNLAKKQLTEQVFNGVCSMVEEANDRAAELRTLIDRQEHRQLSEFSRKELLNEIDRRMGLH